LTDQKNDVWFVSLQAIKPNNLSKNKSLIALDKIIRRTNEQTRQSTNNTKPSSLIQYNLPSNVYSEICQNLILNKLEFCKTNLLK